MPVVPVGAWKSMAVGGLLGVPGQPRMQDEILSLKTKTMERAGIQGPKHN